VAHKSNPLPNYQKIGIKSYQNLPIKIGLFVKLKYKSVLNTLQCGPKSKPIPSDQKVVLYRTKACQWLDLFEKLKYESSTIILYVAIRYSVRDLGLLSDCNNYA